jgi:NitT/TauT family transport system ATP-binding protein
VVLVEAGRRFLAESVPERKLHVRERVSQLQLFRDLLEQLQRAEGHEIDEDYILSTIALRLPYEDSERVFRTLINWARHADLFDHDVARKKLFLEARAPGT